MNNKKMVEGIKIEFNEEDNHYFEDEWNNDIDGNLLITSLLETINDICEKNGINTKEVLTRYIELGSVDDYISSEEKQKMDNYKTF